jgi:hypothetical protein
MRAVDHLAGGPTVRGESFALAAQAAEDLSPGAHRRLGCGDSDEMVRLYATGYWRVRGLDDGDGQRLRERLASP